MVIAKYRDSSGNVVEAIQFRRTDWKKIRHFTDGKAHSMIVPACENEQATFGIKLYENKVTVFEGEWITKNDQNALFIYSADDFLKIFNLVKYG